MSLRSTIRSATEHLSKTRMAAAMITVLLVPLGDASSQDSTDQISSSRRAVPATTPADAATDRPTAPAGTATSNGSTTPREPNRFTPHNARPLVAQNTPSSGHLRSTPASNLAVGASEPIERTSYLDTPVNTLRWRSSTNAPARAPSHSSIAAPSADQIPTSPEGGSATIAAQYTERSPQFTQDAGRPEPIHDPFGDYQAPAEPVPVEPANLSTPTIAPTAVETLPNATWHPPTQSNTGLNAAIPSGGRHNSHSTSYYQQDIPRAQLTTVDQARQLLHEDPIQSINLNVTPWLDAEAENYDTELMRRNELMASQADRIWRDTAGNELVIGRLVAVENRTALIELGSGEHVRIAVLDLAVADQEYVYQAWRYPAETLIAGGDMPNRDWMPQTVTWKASALCHKSLFFEDIQLERYGHSAGPILQPLKSTAHFFTHMAFAPYNSAIHPATECNYALGFYRPGDCAPWLVDPIPLSARGGLKQALFITSGVLTIP